jgi:hypothetical protein
LVRCWSKALRKSAFAFCNFLDVYKVESQATYEYIDGDNQWNSEGSISTNFGIGLINPTLKAS